MGNYVSPRESKKRELEPEVKTKYALLAAWVLNLSESIQAFRLNASRVGMSYFIGSGVAR